MIPQDANSPGPRAAAPLPWPLVLPAVLCGVGVAGPMVYLLVRALGADAGRLGALLASWRNAALLVNTALLGAGVLAVTTALALPAAWLTARTDLPGRRGWVLGMVLPLAVPGYLTAFALLSLGGNIGVVAKVTGGAQVFPVIRGYPGALIALSLYNFPYMLLTLRAAILMLDQSLVEAARALGRSWPVVAVTVVLPQLRPALVAGGLLVLLHVLADFGVVHLMGFRTFSYALYEQYDSVNPAGAAWVALMMVALAVALLGLDAFLLRGVRLHRAGSGMGRGRATGRLGRWRWPAVALPLVIVLLGVALPAATTAFWLFEPTFDSGANLRRQLIEATADSGLAAAAAAVAAALLALPVATLGARYASKRAGTLMRVAYFGYATPGLAFALGLAAASLVLDRLFVEAGSTLMYQSLAVLVYGYALHFMAEAVGPIRAALYQATPRLEEASRSLGRGFLRTFFTVTLPLLRPGLVSALALVFLSTMKELPLTMLLKPNDFESLAYNIWDKTNEGLFADAAPFAVCLLAVSLVVVGALLLSESAPREAAARPGPGSGAAASAGPGAGAPAG